MRGKEVTKVTEVINDPGGDAMGKPYWNGPEGSYETSGARRFAGRYASGENGAAGHDDSHPAYGRSATDTYDAQTHRFEPEGFGDPKDHHEYDEYDEYDGYDEEFDDYPPDTRWRWIAGLAGAILLIAAVAIAFAMRGGGDTASTSATPSDTASATSVPQDAVSTTPRTVIATIPPSTPAAADPLPPETIVTVTTTPSAHEGAPQPPAPPGPAPAEAAPPPPPERTITYTVTGTRSLFDLVTIIYSDEQGFPRTDINVALPWTRTVVLNPGVETKSLTATSLTGQLNCAVTDGNGAVLKQQNTNTAVSAC
jgi:hypothetical protein